MKHSEETKKKISESKKGSIPWNVGVTHTLETRKKISETRKLIGTSLSQLEVLKRMSRNNKGRKLTQYQKDCLRKANTGKIVSKETRLKIIIANKGKMSSRKGVRLSDETKLKLRMANLGKVGYGKGKKRPKVSGKNHWNWKGGINPINDTLRKTLEYKLWRESVFKRDNYICVIGGKEHGNDLQADHIKPFALFPELRFAIDNGRTLCVECHKKTDTYAGRSNKKLLT